MQQLSVNLTIPIPSDSVLISKIELEEYKRKELEGVFWNMKDLEQRVGKKHDWIKERILHQPHFQRILDVDLGGFVYYPKGRGDTWTFHASKMADFLDKNFHSIFRERG